LSHREDAPTVYLTHADLWRINEASIQAGRNRTLHFERLPLEDDETLYPIVLAMVHNDAEIRARIVLTAAGDSAWLDMSFEDYASLPRLYVPL